MAYYNINPEKRNFLQRGFVSVDSQSGQVTGDLNPFLLIQDPTFLTFKVEFWFPEGVSRPDGGGSNSTSTPADQFLQAVVSHEGLLQPPKFNIDNANVKGGGKNTPDNPAIVSQFNLSDYNFKDSAEDYLYAIGSADRIAALRSFKNILYKLQVETPWYFQKIGGADNLFKVTPGNNVRQENTLTFECLESVDLRASLLADMYRTAAWDFQRHREVLPYNLRTFRMRIHVLEMRDFNRSFGAIAQLIKGDKGVQKEYERIMSVANGAAQVGAQAARAITGGIPSSSYVQSAFDALSFQTYELGLCEFDFFSDSQDFLSELTVVDPQMATFKFGVKYQTVRKTAKYSFYDFMDDYVVRNSMFPGKALVNGFQIGVVDLKSPSVVPFYDAESNKTTIKPYNLGDVAKHENTLILSDRNTPNAAFQTARATEKIREDRNAVRNIAPNPGPQVGGILGRAIGAVESRIATAINQVESRVNQILLGNVYDNIPSPAEASQALLGFFNPDLGLSMGGERSQSVYDPGSVQFDPTPVDNSLSPLTFDATPSDNTLTQSPLSPLPVDTTITGGGLDPLPIDTTVTGGGLDPLPIDTTITGGGLVPLPVDTNITGGGLTPLPVDRNIIGGGLDPLPVDRDVIGGGLDPLAVDTDITNITLSGNRPSTTINGIGTLEGTVPSGEIQKTELEGPPAEDSPISDGSVSVFTTYLDVDIPEEIIESPLNELQVDKTIQGGGMSGVTPDLSVNPTSMQPLDVSKEIVGGGLSGIVPSTEISGVSLEGVSPTREVQGGGYESMTTPSEISGLTLEGTTPERSVQGGGYDPLLTDSTITEISLSGQTPDSKISGISLSGASPKDSISQSPMQSPLPPGELLDDNVNLKGAQVNSELLEKNVNFEAPPKQVQISPKNIFRRS
jgi:hypothetical protein